MDIYTKSFISTICVVVVYKTGLFLTLIRVVEHITLGFSYIFLIAGCLYFLDTYFNFSKYIKLSNIHENVYKFHHEETVFIDNDPDHWSTPIDINLPVGSFILSLLYDDKTCVYICSISEIDSVKILDYTPFNTKNINLFKLVYEDSRVFIYNQENDGAPSIVTVKITLI